jgi:hypothetical protein
VTCSCGWTSDFSQRWAAESAAKLHLKIGDTSIAHAVTLEESPADYDNVPAYRSATIWSTHIASAIPTTAVTSGIASLIACTSYRYRRAKRAERTEQGARAPLGMTAADAHAGPVV